MKLRLRCTAVLISVVIMISYFNINVLAAEKTENLVLNGGFENSLANWKLVADNTAVVDKAYAKNGNGGFMMIGGAKEQYAYHYTETIDRSKTYELSAWVKCEAVSTDNAFFLGVLGVCQSPHAATGWIYGPGDAPNPRHYSLCSTGGTHGWKKISYVFDAAVLSEDTEVVQVYCYLEGGIGGTVYVDDVSLKPLEFDVVPSFDRFANVLVKGENMQINMQARNNSNITKEVMIEYSITDDYYSLLYKGTDSFTANAFKNTDYKMQLPVKDCGAYHIDMHITTADGSFDLTKRTSFVVIMENNSDNTAYDFGVASHMGRTTYHNANAKNYIEAMKLAGCGWIRDEFRWAEMERQKGVYAPTEKMINTAKYAKENGLKVVALMAFGNEVYDMGIGAVPETPAQLEGFKNYAEQAALMFKNLGFAEDEVVYEVWNEYTGFNPTRAPVSHFVNVAKAVKEGVSKVMPNAVVSTEGMQHCLDGKGTERILGYLSTGSLEYCDGIGMHPYTYPLMPDENDLFELGVDEFRGYAKEYGKEDITIYHTEVGWKLQPGAKYGMMHDRENAISNIRLYVLNKKVNAKYNSDDIIFVYQLAEQHYVANDSFGLLRLAWSVDGPNSARMSYATFASAVSMLNDATYQDCYDGGNIKTYKFRSDDGKDILVMWTEQENEDISLECNGNPTVYGMSGDVKAVPFSNGKINMTISREPTFVVGNLPNIVPQLSAIKILANDDECYKGEFCTVTIEGDKKYAGKEMTITPDLPLGWEWDNDDAELKADGRNELIIKAPSNIDDSRNNLKFIVSIDGVQTAHLECKTTATTPLAAKALRMPYNEKGESKDTIRIAVNNFGSYDLSGHIMITAPTYMNNKYGFSVEGGKESYVYIPVTQYPEFGYYDMEYEVYLDGSNTPYKFTEKINFLDVAYADKAPKIDGVVSSGEWDDAKSVDIVDPTLIKALITDDPNPTDTIGTLYTMWDTDNLYCAAIVNDDVHCNNAEVGRIWDGDCIQVAIDTKRSDPDESKWVEYCVGILEKGPAHEQDRLLSWQTDGKNPNIVSYAVRDEKTKTTVYEVMIPWSETIHEGAEFDPESAIGFSFAVNDDDGYGRKGFTHYMNGIVDAKYKDRFGQMWLMDIPNQVNELTLFTDSSKALKNDNVVPIDSENSSVKPLMKNDRILVPARFISESFGARVDWNEETNEVTVTKGTTVLEFTIGSDVYYINGTSYLMDTTAITENGRTMLPLRVITEGIGKHIYWNDKGVIIITADCKDYTQEYVDSKLSKVMK